MDKKNLKHGFTIIEILVVAPIVILVIGTFISAIVSMTGEVLVSRGTALLSYNIQDALNRIEQDITTSDAYLVTNNINIVSPQGYNNDTTYFHNADATNGTMLILNTYATTENPLSPTRNTIYIPNTPNACSSPSINKNIPVVMNTVYFVKNNTLWRRTIATGSYATIGCSIPWQQPSCAPGVINAFCKTQDIRLVDGIQSGGFSVRYYSSPISTTASSIASDSTQTDADRLVALQTNSTAVVTITATSTIAGRSVTQTGTIRAISPNIPSQAIVTNGLVLNLDAGNPESYPGSGTIWTDLSGNGNSATLVGGVVYSNVNSGVMNVDGTTGYITAGSGSSLNFGIGSFTVSYWAKYDDYTYPKTFGSIKKSSPNCFSAGGKGWDFGHTYNTSGIDVCINDGVNLVRNTLIFNVGSRPPDLLNKWTHLVYAVDRSSDKVIGYVNGVRQTNEIDISAVTGSTDNTDTLVFGTLYGWFVDGMISDVSLYNDKLSDGEILQNFNALRGRYGI